jgi:CelD/BcsL family acetyltransferase involved in cellulose biosynthesis
MSCSATAVRLRSSEAIAKPARTRASGALVQAPTGALRWRSRGLRLRSMSMEEQAGELRLELNSDPETLSGAWDELADRLAVTPFLRPGWILPWSRAFAKGRLVALTASRDGALVGLLPFIKRRGLLSAPANWHSPLFGFLASDPDVSAALASDLVSRARVRADLSFLDRADPNLAQCQIAAERARRPAVLRAVLHSPYVPLADTDWEGYRATLDRKARKDVERRKRRLEEQGSVSVEFVDGGADLEQLLEEGFRLEGSGWKHERGSAITSDPRTQRFYTEIARWASARGWLLLAFLRLEGKPIAFDFCLESSGANYVLKGGFDPSLRRFAPGMVLTYESLRRAFERGLASYELLGDDAPYKLVWTQTVRERVRFQAFARSPRGRVNHLAWTRGRAAVRRTLETAQRSDPRRAAV